MPNLEYLNLDYNYIGDEAQTKITDTFKHKDESNLYLSNQRRLSYQKKQGNTFVCIPNVNGRYNTLADCKNIDDTNSTRDSATSSQYILYG